ncbi:MAG: twin-arginine translocation signal domain-containing protein [Haloarculaceae archaeon]
MKRRTVLAKTGALGAGALTAGCAQRAGDRGAPPDDGTDPGSDDDETDTMPDDETPTTDRFAGDPCPSFDESADRTVCAHTVDPNAAAVYLTASEQVFAPTTGDHSVEMIQFDLHNEGDENVGLNPYAWGIERQSHDGWEHVAPDVHIEPWTELAPGETYTWVLSVQEHPSPHAPRTQQIVQDLQSGTYAFDVTCLRDDGSKEATRIEAVALFAVERQ